MKAGGRCQRSAVETFCSEILLSPEAVPDGHDPGLVLCCLDGIAAGGAHGELEAGEDHQFPLKATDSHSRVGQDQAQGPESSCSSWEPALCLGQ